MSQNSVPMVTIKTPLCNDVNVVQAGTPVEVHVHLDKKEESGDREGNGEEEAEPIMAMANGKVMGAAEVDILKEGPGMFVARLVPSTPDEYTLEVLHEGEHISGSPFLIIAADKTALSAASVNQSDEPISIMAGHQVRLIIPVNGIKKNVAVSVNGPSGVCESTISSETDELTTISFKPNVPGKYTISVKVNGSAVDGSPYQIMAKGKEPDASKCFILEEDLQVFKNPLRFGQGGEPARFRVSTVDAGHGVLSIVSQGPGTVDVRTFNGGEGTETCVFSPSMAGKYFVDVLWAGVHIPGSPYQLNFRRPKTRIVSNGLNLQNEVFHIGEPHRFRLNCQGLGDDKLEVVCEPESAAEITVTTVGERSYACQILPVVVGDHRIMICYKKKHIAGSPFDVHFSPDITKCKLVHGSREHEIGSQVQFLVSVREAGRGGELTSVVRNKANQETIPAVVSKVTDDRFQVEFNPGEVMECEMEIRYDNEHIRGSPFNLIFSDPSRCRAEGQGLVSAECNQLGKFTVATEDAGPGTLKVIIKDEEGRETEPVLSAISPTEIEVSYRIPRAGNYRIHVHWGKFDIPGSPFEAYCYDMTEFHVNNVPKESYLGKPIGFTVESSAEIAAAQTEKGRELGKLIVHAKSTRGAEIVGETEQDNSGNYICRLVPEVTGKYDVRVHWNGTLVQGSPFRVRVVSPPIPGKVKAHGPGLQDGLVGQEGNFIVETTDAGTGLLAVRVHGPKGAFKINTNRDRSHPRNILVSYNPTHIGSYKIEITWAGVNIPGSPFKVAIGLEKPRSRSREEGGVTQAEIESTSDKHKVEGVTQAEIEDSSTYETPCSPADGAPQEQSQDQLGAKEEEEKATADVGAMERDKEEKHRESEKGAEEATEKVEEGKMDEERRQEDKAVGEEETEKGADGKVEEEQREEKDGGEEEKAEGESETATEKGEEGKLEEERREERDGGEEEKAAREEDTESGFGDDQVQRSEEAESEGKGEQGSEET